MRRGAGAAIVLLLAACRPAPVPARADARFPAADRPVSSIVSIRWSDEDTRDRAGEAAWVMDRAGIAPGMTVADIGAGDGYYTVRLSPRVGPRGRVIAEDILAEAKAALDARVAAQRLGNVTVVLGTPDDARLAPASIDRALLIHMYHEIASPYAFLWHLHPALKPGGRVVVVDADRPTGAHGTPPALLDCELAAVGYARVARHAMPSASGYLAMYEARGARPAPAAIRACGNKAG